MKKRHYNKLKNFLLIILCALFYSCKKPIIGKKVVVSGQFIEKFSNTPLANISLTLSRPYFGLMYNELTIDKTSTDQSGNFYLEARVPILANGKEFYLDYMPEIRNNQPMYYSLDSEEGKIILSNRKTENMVIYLYQYSIFKIHLMNQSHSFSYFGFSHDTLTEAYANIQTQEVFTIENYVKGNNAYSISIYGSNTYNANENLALFYDTTFTMAPLDTVEVNVVF